MLILSIKRTYPMAKAPDMFFFVYKIAQKDRRVKSAVF